MNKTKNILFALFIAIIFISTSIASVHLAPKIRKSPSDLVYEVGTTNNTLTWAFEADESNDLPSKYTATMDGVPMENHTLQTWQDNVDVIVNVDGLALGSHVIIMTVNDTGTDSGQADAAVDSVSINVVEDINNISSTSSSSTTSSTTNTPSDSVTTITSSDLLTSTSTSDAAIPFLAMIAALIIGIPILKIKDFRS